MIEALWILIVIGIVCSLIGNILVQKQSVMVADAISHTILLGIVLAYLIVRNLDSPILIIGASIFGVITALAIELVTKHSNTQRDAAIGLIFTAFFSIAVIIISKYLSNIHLDIDTVLLGEIIFAPLNRMEILRFSLPIALIQNLLTLLIVIAFLIIFQRIIKIRLFDDIFAQSIGIPINKFDLILMILVSLVAVVAFQSVGAILVIALMVAPALTAQIFAKSYFQLMLLGCFFATLSAIMGYHVSIWLNVTMSGTVAVSSFIIFLTAFILKNSK